VSANPQTSQLLYLAFYWENILLTYICSILSWQNHFSTLRQLSSVTESVVKLCHCTIVLCCEIIITCLNP